ncbi:MAG: Na+/H+ antiporter subunit E [Anaerosomatales bacterium]|nr:Na+/H+ antiporter subunit E [Anaerosomatales bacterium]
MTAIWWAISEGDTAALAVGAPAALAAALISLALHPDPLPVVRPLGLLRFAGFFLVHSVRGGIDVALRALKPSMPIDPRIITYDLRLPGNTARVVFTNTLSLLPGTLSAKLGRDTLEVHVLDCAGEVTAEIARVEDRVADLFGVRLAPHAGGAC